MWSGKLPKWGTAAAQKASSKGQEVGNTFLGQRPRGRVAHQGIDCIVCAVPCKVARAQGRVVSGLRHGRINATVEKPTTEAKREEDTVEPKRPVPEKAQ